PRNERDACGRRRRSGHVERRRGGAYRLTARGAGGVCRLVDLSLDHLEVVERLENDAARAEPAGDLDVVGRGVGGHHQDLGLEVDLLHVVHQLEAGEAGHVDVGQDEIDPLGGEVLHGLRAAGGDEEVEVGAPAQQIGQEVPDVRVVVDDQEVQSVHGSLSAD